MRTGWVEVADGVAVPNEAIINGPSVRWRHIDGPLMTWGGQLHWLTWRERLAIWLGRATVDQVAVKHWPRLAAIRDHLANGEPRSSVVPGSGR